MKKEINLTDVTAENVANTDLWEISNENFDTTFAKILRRDARHLKSYKKKVIKEYNETKNLKAFLASLRIIAMAERNIPKLAKKVNMGHSNVYEILSGDNNPAFANLAIIAHNLGIDFITCVAK
jgi:DNA-binding phage protein